MKRMKKQLLLASFIFTIVTAGIAHADIKQVSTGPENQIQWQYRNGKWYGYNKNGNPGHGWIQDGQKHYYLDAEGACLINQITPDGYYVDTNGAWHQRSTEIFNVVFDAPVKFPSASSPWADESALKGMKKEIDALFDTRRIRITENAVEYLAGDTKESTLIGIYKDPENGSFRMDLRLNLDKSSAEKDAAATYDYMVFRAMLHQITSTPDLLENAIYSSWEEENRWNISRTGYTPIGDAQVKYTAGNGYGCYQVYPAN